MTNIHPISRKKPRTVHHNKVVRVLFFVLGCVSLMLAVIGVIVPGMPTTVFVLMAGFCWARSSRRFYVWLMRHRLFGRLLRNWQKNRAMPRAAKYMAWSMMALSNALLMSRLPMDKWWLSASVALLCLMVAVWMARLPDA